MKIRAKANRNILEASDEEAKELIATGIYEAVEDEEEDEEKETPAPTYKTRDGARHKRRDMRAEE